MESNFAFLIKEKDFQEFAPLCVQAEEAMAISPVLASTMARSALERMVHWLYGAMDLRAPISYGENGKEYAPTLASMLKNPAFRAEVTERPIYEAMWAVVKLGNTAVHGATTTEAEGFLSLKNLLQVANWMDYLYGTDDDYQESRFFDRTAVPRPGEVSTADRKRLSELEASLRAKEAEEAKREEALSRMETRLGEQAESLAAKEAALQERDTKLAEKDAELARLRAELAARSQEHRVERVFRIDGATEAETRAYLIDEALREAGWSRGRNLDVEVPVGIAGGEGYADYVLYDDARRPVALVEAKRTSVDAQTGAVQAREYAEGFQRTYGRLPLIFLANGYETWYIDPAAKAPRRRVAGFFTPEEAARRLAARNRKALATFPPRAAIANRPYQLQAVQRVAEAADAGRRRFLLVLATGIGANGKSLYVL